ncbi:MAG: hypothetical protein E2O60_00950 [Gammaproteobacteria bacterium]|nr:MAG: hypothetical protein E2O60_00950 [Gammaproteobacteria bacterium]
MKQAPGISDYLWIASEICYYLGLMAAFLIPTLALILWMMSLVDKADPNYWYLLIAWGMSIMLFLAGVMIKNRICSAEKSEQES